VIAVDTNVLLRQAEKARQLIETQEPVLITDVIGPSHRHPRVSVIEPF
jgi:hypothetical protein